MEGNLKCLRCQEEMTEVNINTGGGAFLIEKKGSGFFKGTYSGVLSLVCTKCGHVELMVKNPGIFKEEK